MKIIREGKEFELTADELLAAYQEQEAIWDRDNIIQNMEFYLSAFEHIALSENESFIASAAAKLRENEDNGLSYDDALRFAFKEAKKEFSAELASFVDPDTFDFSDRKDVDEESEKDFLPEEIQLPSGMVNDEEISDYLSDVTGYCHRSFSLRESTRSSLADQIQSAANRAATSGSSNKSHEKGVTERG